MFSFLNSDKGILFELITSSGKDNAMGICLIYIHFICNFTSCMVFSSLEKDTR